MELEDAAGQSGSDDLPRELARLERRLASGDATRGRVIDELARVRHDLVRGDDRAPGLRIADLRIASPCKQSWADMIGDDPHQLVGSSALDDKLERPAPHRVVSEANYPRVKR
jgi:hypothetical protein